MALRFQRLAHLELAFGQLAVRAILQQLQVSEEDIDRRLQLVRRDGHEFRLEFIQLRELPGHRREAGRQTAKLVVARGREREAVAELPFGYRLHSRFELFDRPADRAGEPGGDPRCQQRREREDGGRELAGSLRGICRGSDTVTGALTQ